MSTIQEEISDLRQANKQNVLTFGIEKEVMSGEIAEARAQNGRILNQELAKAQGHAASMAESNCQLTLQLEVMNGEISEARAHANSLKDINHRLANQQEDERGRIGILNQELASMTETNRRLTQQLESEKAKLGGIVGKVDGLENVCIRLTETRRELDDTRQSEVETRHNLDTMTLHKSQLIDELDAKTQEITRCNCELTAVNS